MFYFIQGPPIPVLGFTLIMYQVFYFIKQGPPIPALGFIKQSPGILTLLRIKKAINVYPV